MQIAGAQQRRKLGPFGFVVLVGFGAVSHFMCGDMLS